MKLHDTHGWIWPKDPRPGNPTHWPRRWRLFDILTNKGPDIFVGRIRPDRSSVKKKRAETGVEAEAGSQERTSQSQSQPLRMATSWAGWDDVYGNDDGDQNREKKKRSPFPWARRNSAERYDFRTKRYCIPNSGTWSRVEYCSGDDYHKGRRRRHVIPMRYWDQNGNEYPAGYWHDVVYGTHRDCCDRGHGRRR